MEYFKKRSVGLLLISLSIISIIFLKMIKIDGKSYYDLVFLFDKIIPYDKALFYVFIFLAISVTVFFSLTDNSIKKAILSDEILPTLKKLKAIKLIKRLSLILGIVLAISYFAFNSYMDFASEREISNFRESINDKNSEDHFYKEISLKFSHTIKRLNFDFIIAFIGLIFCGYLSRYNRGKGVWWMLFGFLVPYVTLVLAGLDFSLKKEYKDHLKNH